jgi:predicted nucleic acid-binding protein
MSGRTLYYWDACVFLGLLTNDKDENEMLGVLQVAEQFQQSKVIIMTSTITRIEVLSSHLSDEQKQTFQKVFMRSNFQEHAVDIRVANIAHNIRDHYIQNRPSKISVKTPDSIHLATAIHYKADEMHTFDGKKKGGLIRFSGIVADKYSLQINPPPADRQKDLVNIEMLKKSKTLH